MSLLREDAWPMARRAVLGGLAAAALPGAVRAQARGAPALMAAMNIIELAPQWQADGAVTIVRGGSTQQRAVSIATIRQGAAALGVRRYRFTTPADIRGTALLVRENRGADNDLWLLLPALGRVRRITSSKLDGAFAGTDFSYADLMPMQLDRYAHALLREEALRGTPHAVIESRPAADHAASIGYSAIRTWVRRADAVPSQVEYDDLRGKHVKTQIIGQPQPAGGGAFVMTDRQMRRLDTGSQTSIRLRNVRFDAGATLADFTPQRLEAL